MNLAVAWAEKRRVAGLVAPHPTPPPAPPSTLRRRERAPQRLPPEVSVAVCLTPGEHARLARLHRWCIAHEGTNAGRIESEVAAAIACFDEWPLTAAEPKHTAVEMARYREEWGREQQSVVLRVALEPAVFSGLQRLAGAMGWSREDAARYAIRHLCDVYEDQEDMGPLPAPPAPPRVPVASGGTAELPEREQPRSTPASPPPEPVAARVAETPRTPRQVAPAPTPPRDAQPAFPRPRPAPEPSPTRPLTYKDMSPEQERDLVRRYQGGDRRAGDILLQAHERLIFQQAMRYRKRGVDDDDLLQAARMGFEHAIVKWLEEEGAKLSTYAIIWMRQYLQRSLDDTAATIRVPARMCVQLRKARREGLEMSDKVTAAHLVLKTSSLDAPVGDDSDSATLGDLTADAGPSPDALVEGADAGDRRRALIETALARLKPTEADVIRRRMLSDEPQTLEEVGNIYGVTRERVRQIEAKAMAKLERALRRQVKTDDAVLWSGA